MNKAVFLDKDGTLIPDIPYNVDPDLITLENLTVDGLKILHKQGYLLVVISNQSGVARGYFTEDKLKAVEWKIQELFSLHGITLAGFYYCPHHPEGNVSRFNISCNCRKPRPGMILTAAKDFDVDISLSWMVGDILNDVEAGNRAGCKTILIDNGNETEWLKGDYRNPMHVCQNINHAVQKITDTDGLEEL